MYRANQFDQFQIHRSSSDQRLYYIYYIWNLVNKIIIKVDRVGDIDNYEALATTTLIKRANLSLSQKLLVDMLQKIFFQPGAGRKEAALLRGMGVSANKPLGERILRKLMDENFVTRHKGDEGYIYKAQRSQTGRVKKIMTDLTLSNDPLWKYISSLSK